MESDFKQHALWSPQFDTLTTEEKINVLRTVVLEIASTLQQNISFELRHELEKKIGHAELRGLRDDMQDVLETKIYEVKADISRELARLERLYEEMS